jgi:hypothetical protein
MRTTLLDEKCIPRYRHQCIHGSVQRYMGILGKVVGHGGCLHPRLHTKIGATGDSAVSNGLTETTDQGNQSFEMTRAGVKRVTASGGGCNAGLTRLTSCGDNRPEASASEHLASRQRRDHVHSTQASSRFPVSARYFGSAACHGDNGEDRPGAARILPCHPDQTFRSN